MCDFNANSRPHQGIKCEPGECFRDVLVMNWRCSGGESATPATCAELVERIELVTRAELVARAELIAWLALRTCAELVERAEELQRAELEELRRVRSCCGSGGILRPSGGG